MNDRTMRNEYEYYKRYFRFMYGDSAYIVPYEKFKAQYPFWCPANHLDLDKLERRKQHD